MSSARTGGGRDDWRTPECVLGRVRKVGPIGLDPCASILHPIGCVNYTEAMNGLSLYWSGHGLVYVNPPYSKLQTWLARCASIAANGTEIVALVPARTDTRAWHESAITARAVCFWRGRISFVGAPLDKYGRPVSAPFPSAVLYWGPAGKLGCFTAAFGDAGAIYTRALTRQDV
jgi:site-specific DNA-methyltransferase (adenine-specific)